MRAPTDLPPPPRWLHLLFLAGIAGLAVWLRLRHVGALSFWLDEVASVRFAELPVADLWGADNHPPLFYFLLHFWLEWVGYDEGRLRLLTVAISLATLPAVYLVGRRIGGPWVALAATLVVACSPFEVRYAQELRMYSLLSCAVAWTLVGFGALVADPERAARRESRGAWALLVAGTGVALYAQHLAVLLPMTTTLLVCLLWWRLPQRSALAWRWAAAHVAVLLIWMPFWPELLRQTGVTTWQWIEAPTVDFIAYVQLQLAYGLPNVTEPLSGPGFAGLLVLTVLGWCALPRRSPWRLALPVLALLPALVALAVSWLYRPVYLARPLIWTGLPVALLVAAGLVAALSLRPLRWRVAGAIVLVLAVAGSGYGLWFHYKVFGKANWRDVAPLVWELTGPGETVVVPNSEFVALDYYLERVAGEQRPHVLGTWSRQPIRALALVAAIPASAQGFMLVDVTWKHDMLLLSSALHWRFPCHQANQVGRRHGIDLWRYEPQESCGQ